MKDARPASASAHSSAEQTHNQNNCNSRRSEEVSTKDWKRSPSPALHRAAALGHQKSFTSRLHQHPRHSLAPAPCRCCRHTDRIHSFLPAATPRQRAASHRLAACPPVAPSAPATAPALATPPAVLSFPTRHSRCTSPRQHLIYSTVDTTPRALPSEGARQLAGTSWIGVEQQR